MTNEERAMILQALRYHADALKKESKSRKWGGAFFAAHRKSLREQAKQRYELAHRMAEGS